MVRTARAWDIGLAAAILAVVLLGWLTAPGSNGGALHSRQFVGPVPLSGRAGRGGGVTGNFYVAPVGYSPRAYPAAKTLQRPPGHRPAPSLIRPALPRVRSDQVRARSEAAGAGSRVSTLATGKRGRRRRGR
jgi:hypothetical protein